MVFERRGVATAFLCPAPFTGIIRAEAQRCGFSDYEPVTLPVPIVGLTEAQTLEVIDQVGPEIVRKLLIGNEDLAERKMP